jgi:hypothetical protein
LRQSNFVLYPHTYMLNFFFFILDFHVLCTFIHSAHSLAFILRGEFHCEINYRSEW